MISILKLLMGKFSTSNLLIGAKKMCKIFYSNEEIVLFYWLLQFFKYTFLKKKLLYISKLSIKHIY